jgi:hypothetical protein
LGTRKIIDGTEMLALVKAIFLGLHVSLYPLQMLDSEVPLLEGIARENVINIVIRFCDLDSSPRARSLARRPCRSMIDYERRIWWAYLASVAYPASFGPP